MNNKIQVLMGLDYKVLFKNNLVADLQSTVNFHPLELSYINDATNESLRLQRANAYSLLKLKPSFWVNHLKSGAPILMVDKSVSELSISISHKDNVLAVGVALTSENNVGIDLEILNTGKNFNFLKNTIIDEKEHLLLNRICDLYKLNLSDVPLFFWTLKEAAYKTLTGNMNISDFKISLDNDKIILNCLNSNLTFLSEVFIVDKSMIAVVTTKKIITDTIGY